MTRRSRQPAEWHHVMNRGRCKATIFHTRADAAMFLDIVGESLVDEIEVHAYALMNNHYHLLMRGPTEQVSKVMQSVGSRFTRRMNHRYGGDGAIFRGRVNVIPVLTPQHLDIVGWYIHRNPLDRRPQPRLETYEWSSLRAHLGLHPGPSWLSTDWLLDSPQRTSQQYLEYIHCDQIGTEVDDDVLAWAIESVLLEIDVPARDQRRVSATIRALLRSPNDASEATAKARYRADHRVANAPWIDEAARRVANLLGVRLYPSGMCGADGPA